MFFWRHPSKFLLAFFLDHYITVPNMKVLMMAFFFLHSYIDLLVLEVLWSPLSRAVIFIVLAAASVRHSLSLLRFFSDNIFFNQFRVIISIFHMHPFACFHYLWLLHTDLVSDRYYHGEVLYSNIISFVFHSSTTLFPVIKQEKSRSYSFY